MDESKRVGVQCLAVKCHKCFFNGSGRGIVKGAGIPASICVIACYGVSDMTEMDTDLVDTSRLQCQFEKGVPVIPFKEVIVSNRMTTPHPCYCHLPPISRTSDDTGIDGSCFVGGDAANDSVVVACGGVCLKLS
jgi:hypothetical protein